MLHQLFELITEDCHLCPSWLQGISRVQHDDPTILITDYINHWVTLGVISNVKNFSLSVEPDSQRSTRSLFLTDCSLVQESDACIQARWEDLWVSALPLGVVFHDTDLEGEKLFRVGSALDYGLESLSDLRLDFCFSMLQVWVVLLTKGLLQPEVDLNECLLIVLLGAELSLRWTV